MSVSDPSMGAAPATRRARAGLANGSAETSAERGTGSGEAPGSIPPIAEAGRATERPETRGMAGRDSGRVDIFLGMFWMDVPNFCSHSHPPRPKRPKRFSELTQYGLLHSTVYVTLQCQPHTKTHPAHTFRLDSGNGSDRGGMFEVAKVRLGRPVEGQCGFGNPPPLSAKRRPMKHRPNSADRFDRNRRNGRNVFGAVCFARTGVSGRSVSVRRTS